MAKIYSMSDNLQRRKCGELRILCKRGDLRNADVNPFPLYLVGVERTPVQLYRSIRAYLLWRSGAEWQTDRHDPRRVEYLAALNTLNQAFNRPDDEDLRFAALAEKLGIGRRRSG